MLFAAQSVAQEGRSGGDLALVRSADGGQTLCAHALWAAWGEMRLVVSNDGFQSFVQDDSLLHLEWLRGMGNLPQEIPLPPTVPHLGDAWGRLHKRRTEISSARLQERCSALPMAGADLPFPEPPAAFGILSSGRWLAVYQHVIVPWRQGRHEMMGAVGGYPTFRISGEFCDADLVPSFSDDAGKTWANGEPFGGPLKWAIPSVRRFIEDSGGSHSPAPSTSPWDPAGGDRAARRRRGLHVSNALLSGGREWSSATITGGAFSTRSPGRTKPYTHLPTGRTSSSYSLERATVPTCPPECIGGSYGGSNVTIQDREPFEYLQSVG